MPLKCHLLKIIYRRNLYNCEIDTSPDPLIFCCWYCIYLNRNLKNVVEFCYRFWFLFSCCAAFRLAEISFDISVTVFVIYCVVKPKQLDDVTPTFLFCLWDNFSMSLFRVVFLSVIVLCKKIKLYISTSCSINLFPQYIHRVQYKTCPFISNRNTVNSLPILAARAIRI